MALSNLWLKRNYGKAQTRPDFIEPDRGGLGARVRNGKISFVYRPYFKGKQLKMTLGSYPAMSLKEAREKAIEYRNVIEQGFDPRKKQLQTKTDNAEEMTIGEIFDIYIDKSLKRRNQAWEHLSGFFDRHLRGEIGSKLYSDITRKYLMGVFDSIGQKTPEVARRLISNLRQAFDFAYNRGLTEREDNPMDKINDKTLQLPQKGRGVRSLSREEIGVLYGCMDKMNIHKRSKIIIELLLFYGCRSSELQKTERDWVDFDRMVWSVPAHAHKTGLTTKLPLERPILPEMRGHFEFLLNFSSHREYICTKLNKSDELDSGEILSRRGLQIIPVQIWEAGKKLYAKGDKQYGWERFGAHDLRRTSRTFWTDYGDWVICEKMLGHAIPGTADIYDRNSYIEKMRPVYEQWWRTLKAIQAGDNVVRLNTAKRGA